MKSLPSERICAPQDGYFGVCLTGVPAMCSDSGAAAGEEEAPRRQLLRWSKAETLRLLHAKRKREDGLSIPATAQNGNGSSGCDERFGDANKWRCVSDSLRSHGFDRDHVACKKRWFHLVADYRKIHDWQRSNAALSFWALQPQERREKRLPSGFDRDVYSELDVWIGAGRCSTTSAATPSLNPAPILDDTNAELEDVENEPLVDRVSEPPLASRKKRKQGKEEADASKVHGDFRDSLIHVLEKNGTSIEITLRDICQAQIDAQKQISQAQLEAQKQMIELQMQQGREFVGAMYAMVGVLGELAKSLRSSVNQ